jgi:hypothetical protein
MLSKVSERAPSPPTCDRRQGRRGSTVPALAIAAVAALLAFAGASSPASAHVSRKNVARENAAATHAYLTASVSFEETELANLPQQIAAKEAVATGISGECAGVLTDAPPHEEVLGFGFVGPASKTRPNARAEGERRRQSRQLGDLKTELSFALDDSRTQADHEADEAFIGGLTPLKWSNARITILFHVIAEEAQEELDSPVPAVCADMKAWVASGYKTLSPASKEVGSRLEAGLKRVFELIALLARTPVKTLTHILAPYENAADRALARRSEALTAQLKKVSETQAAILKRLEATAGLPPATAPKPKPAKRKPVVIGRGKTAAGGSFVARAEPPTHAQASLGCVFVTIEEPSRPQGKGLFEIFSSEGIDRCLSRSHLEPEPAVHCNSGLLTVEANLLSKTRSVTLLLSDGDTITSPAILLPAHLGGPAGLYYQVVRGPSPIPVSLTELDAEGRTLTVLKLPAVVECTKHPIKYFPGGIVQLAHGSLPQGPSFTIRGEGYRKLGADHFELKLKVSNEELLFGGGGEGGSLEGGVALPNGVRVLEPQASSGCLPEPYAIVYGLLKAPRDTVLARVSDTLVPLRKVAIPGRLHPGGVLVYGAFTPLPTELLVRNQSGKTVDRKDLSETAKSDTETCEGEAE